MSISIRSRCHPTPLHRRYGWDRRGGRCRMGRFGAAGHGNSAAIDVHARLIAIAALGTKAGETALGRLSGSPGALDAAEWAAPGTSEQTLHALRTGAVQAGISGLHGASSTIHGSVGAPPRYMGRTQRRSPEVRRRPRAMGYIARRPGTRLRIRNKMEAPCDPALLPHGRGPRERISRCIRKCGDGDTESARAERLHATAADMPWPQIRTNHPDLGRHCRLAG